MTLNQYAGLGMRAAFLLTAVLLTWLGGCTQRELSRDTAAFLLNSRNAEWLSVACEVSPRLKTKPEFRSLVESNFCEAEIVVTGVRKISETEAVVESHVVFRGRPTEAQKWLEAFKELERRLTSVTPARRSTMLGYNWEWVDPSDGETFTSYGIGVHPRKDIRHTKEWGELEELRGRVNSLVGQKELTQGTSKDRFQLYDDGWRL